jgi:hypothetical protein
VAVGGGVIRMEEAREGWAAKWEGVGRVGIAYLAMFRTPE